MYPNIHSRAGLVALVFALIISVVSAAPLRISGGMARHGGGFPRRASGKGHLHNHGGRFARPVAPAPAPTTGDGGDQLAPRGIKQAAHKVGAFATSNGVKVTAKVGLKGFGTYQAGLAKGAAFIPVVGAPLSQAFTAYSNTAHLAGNAINANVGKKPQKAINAFNGLSKAWGATPTRRELLEEEVLQQREEYLKERDAYLEERDANIELEERDLYERAFNDALEWE